jgi:translocation and assembly module TamB
MISAGAIRNQEREDLVVRTGQGELHFEVRDGALLQGEMHLPLPDTGNVDGAFSIADIGDIDGSAIDGRVDAVLTDISVLRVLVPSLDRADGRLDAKVDVGGTTNAPVVNGNVTLHDGVLEYRPVGLLLEDVSLEAAFDDARNFDLVGEFRAGEGRGTLKSSGSYGGGMGDVVVALQGSDLRLIDVQDLQATANTDVRIGFDDGVIRLDGSILVPHARISPRSLPVARHSESSDVVVVAGELPAERKDESRSAIVLDGKLEVGLGDDVVVDIDLARASVTGTVTYEWDRNLVPVASGRYEIAGDVQAYGQVLRITEGTIRFPKVPANNPYLRIRAEREIFGNSQIKTAGILVDGTVKRPTVEPYTQPRTTRERALTLLVTGSDFDMEQGVGAIDFGTYIAPRLFVSYGIGLFDQENVISARYDLGKGFGLKATSGQKESGFDVIYHIDR